MREDDDDEEETSLNATRYPCMPSLVALQQMRNRLHLAHLGKKLMKWTALATGRELRRLACEIDETYKNFTEDMRSAFMLIARGRYFYPNLNNIVLEHVGQCASVRVETSTKSISGVKVLQLEVIENGITPYEHLGIDKGGQTIHDAKMAWLDLLKRLIIMLQQRTSFYQLDQAHKSATKKMNMLAKVVIPRTKSSMKYIVDELEEIAREDLYRLKKVLEVKRRKVMEKEAKKVILCPICSRVKNEELVTTKCIICGALLKPDILNESISYKSSKEYEKLEEFKTQINEIMDISRDIVNQGVLAESVEEFLKTAETLREQLDNQDVCKRPLPSDINIKQLCETCKNKFDDESGKHEKNEDTDEKVTETTICIPTLAPGIEPNQMPFTSDKQQYYKLHLQPSFETDLNLGTFETEIQEITKLVRIKNEDGTLTEQKKVIKIKREIKASIKPQTDRNNNPGRAMHYSSSESLPSNRHFNKNTVGIMTIKPIDCPYYNQSISSTVDLDLQIDFFKNSYNSTIRSNSLTTTNLISHTLDGNKKVQNDDRDSYFTSSEMGLLANIIGSMHSLPISKSTSEVITRTPRKIGRSVSFNLDSL